MTERIIFGSWVYHVLEFLGADCILNAAGEFSQAENPISGKCIKKMVAGVT
jgi:hypothetical protein